MGSIFSSEHDYDYANYSSSLETLNLWDNTSINDVHSIEAVMKVTGGHVAKPGEFPHQVYLSHKENGHEIMCSASIIHALLLLTAAHCVFNMTPATIDLVTGEYDLSSSDGTEQRPRVRSIIIHDEYDVRTYANDIAILTLQSPIKLDNFTKVIQIPKPDQVLPSWAYVSGWGSTGNGWTSDVLRKAKLALVNTRWCRLFLKGVAITDGMICAGTGDKDVCAGDSGGPLTCEDARGQKYLCGIISWGYSCEHKNEYKYRAPGAYTDVRKYHGWIENHKFAKRLGPKGLSFGNISLDAFPHQFSLQNASTNSHICSATLIHPLLLLTAAHCVFGKQLGGLRAVTGNHHHLDPANSNVTEEQSRGILQAILHPEYDNVTMDNDIALLRLDKPVRTTYNGSSIIAPPPQPNWSYVGQGILIGWGINSTSTEANDTLSAVGTFEADQVSVEEHSVCVDVYDGNKNPWNRALTQGMLCAGYSGDDSCKEIETAAVLMCRKTESGRVYICGIGSWGYGCGSAHDPMVYTNVSKYRSWISKETRKIRRKQ